MRKLATVRRISDIAPIENADAIECAKVDGWSVVVKKGEFQVGDQICYLEIDSWVPHELAPFLTKSGEPREYKGVKGERLRTVKLRGQISQGLIIPLSAIDAALKSQGLVVFTGFYDDEDLTEALGIEKWERQLDVSLSGQAKGNFPSWCPKTDQERVQNLKNEIDFSGSEEYEVTIKLDGSSMSIGISPEGEFVVCSRNLSLQLDQEGNAFVDMAYKLRAEEKLRSICETNGFNSIMIQGELMGPKIQGNREGLSEHQFFVFDVYVPQLGGYLDAFKRRNGLIGRMFDQVPLYDIGTLAGLGLHSIEDVLKFAEGPSLNESVTREGLVFKEIGSSPFSFKAISNAFLLKNGE
jgi:RNA ligase (TIGR02306 family)